LSVGASTVALGVVGVAFDARCAARDFFNTEARVSCVIG
jgi:hypothetical protein